jgi:hypothetical protein
MAIGLLAAAVAFVRCAQPAPRPDHGDDIRIEVESSVLDVKGADGGIRKLKLEKRVQAAFSRVLFGSEALRRCTTDSDLAARGAVQLHVTVEASGAVSQVKPETSAGLYALAACLKQAVSELTFPRSDRRHQFDFDVVADVAGAH